MNWPALLYHEWRETRDTLHRCTQVVGKIRMALTPLVNHWWNVTLYVSARGLTTSMIPYGDRWFEMEFDFVDHVLRIEVSDGARRDVPLVARPVAEFYADVFAALRALGIECKIWSVPCECADTIPLDRDDMHRSYEREPVERFWRSLALTTEVFAKFRAEFIGKCSPVHFFWGSFDLAVTRFSGRRAPTRPDADAITREAYSHEVSSAGFWPGDERYPRAAFYSYAAPAAEGFSTSRVSPPDAYFNQTLGGFYLDYDVLRAAADPEKTLLDFLHSTYDAAANTASWDRASLERR